MYFMPFLFLTAPGEGFLEGGPVWFHSRSDTSEATVVWLPVPSGGRTVALLSLSVFTVFSGFRDQGDIVMADTRVYIGCQSRFCELFRTQKVFQLRSEARFFLVTCTELEFTFRMNVYINSKINRQSIKIYIS